MKTMKMKKWLRVAIPLFILLSLILITKQYMRNDKLTKTTSVQYTHRLRYGRFSNLLRDGPKTYADGRMENILRFNFKQVETNKKTPDQVQLAVVEEHHEVIPYWFNAVKNGLLPKSGNILIHIDGHADAAMPHFDPRMPFFRWPNTLDELHHMMQGNDVFIQAAAMSGLISRFIFISPSWDKSANITYMATKVDVGTIRVHNVKDPVFCGCMVFPPTQQRQCMYEKSVLPGGATDDDDGNKAGDNQDDNGGDNGGDKDGVGGGFKQNSDVVFIENPDDCKIRIHYYAEQVVDHAALERLTTQHGWLGASGNIILDIDEDYFGVELPGQTLVNAGLKDDNLVHLHVVLAEMFCPKHIDHEGLGNRLMHEVISLIINQCRPSVLSDDDTCHVQLNRMLPLVREVVKAYMKRGMTLFCSDSPRLVTISADMLTECLHHFKLEHLRALMDFGFCLETTPATAHFRDAGIGSLVVCQGANLPNSTVVFLHTPDAAEIRARTTQLQKILEIIDARHRPSVVTLCRSVRDGYTPRSFFRTIETNILNIFKDLPGHYDVEYDENLYGGKGGWPDRHKTR